MCVTLLVCSITPLYTDPPSIRKDCGLPVLTFSIAQSALLPCTTNRGANPAPSFTWYKDGRVVPLGGHFTQNTNGSLLISSALAGDAGLYTCVAANINNEMDTYTISVNISST